MSWGFLLFVPTLGFRGVLRDKNKALDRAVAAYERTSRVTPLRVVKESA
jgi:hypothetical protein